MGINVFSCFDGMSCCQIALNKLGIVPNKYYASEVDKFAMQVTMANFPNTIQIGDIRNVNGKDLGFIDLLAGGSPCQSFSFAGKRKGMSTIDNIEILCLEHYLELKSQNFEFEGQSYLFWEYIRILEELRVINPNIKFLLENVLMGEKWQKILTRAIGINPIQINSALVSAQNRKRLYWTNIGAENDGLFGDIVCKIPQPKDKGILLKDILETDVADKYFLSGKMLDFLNSRNKEVINVNGKSSCFTASGNSGGLHSQMDLIKCVAMRGREAVLTPKRTEYGKAIRKDYESGNIKEQRKNVQSLEPRTDGKTNCLTSVQKDNLVAYGCDYRTDEGIRIRNNGKSGTLAARARNDESCGQLASINNNIRRLTPTECERLQCVPDGYSDFVSDSQRYKILGNGWTIDVISHIFSYLKQ